MTTAPSPSAAPRCALVTGGSTGIGLGICQQLLDAGYQVVNLSRRAAPMQHPRLHNIAVDLADPAATREAAAEAAARHAPTTVVHNAGVIRPALLPDVDIADLALLSQLHLAAAITLVQHSLPAMQAAHFGRIVLISSRGALGLAQRTAYAATKSGMVGMARTWALELARSGVTVNVVAPGPVRSEMLFDAFPDGSPQQTELAGKIPVGRVGEPEDVANAVMFFAAPTSGFVTGQVLYVCGGASIGSLVL